MPCLITASSRAARQLDSASLHLFGGGVPKRWGFIREAERIDRMYVNGERWKINFIALPS